MAVGKQHGQLNALLPTSLIVDVSAMDQTVIIDHCVSTVTALCDSNINANRIEPRLVSTSDESLTCHPPQYHQISEYHKYP